MTEAAGINNPVMVYEPSCANDLEFIESILRSTDTPFALTGERGAQYGLPQLYVDQRDADEVRGFLAELSEDAEGANITSALSPTAARRPLAPAVAFDLPSFLLHVLRIALVVVLLFLMIAVFMFLLSRFENPNPRGLLYANLQMRTSAYALLAGATAATARG